MASMKNLLKVILCIYLIASSETAVFRQATEKEYKFFQELSEHGHVIMDSINPEEFKPQANVALRKNYADPVIIAYAVVKAVCLLYKGIVALFGYRVSVSYTDVPMDKGYSELSQKIRIVYISETDAGKDCVNLGKLSKKLCHYVGFADESDTCKSLARVYEQAKYSDAKMWGKKDFGFRDSPTGDIKYVSIMVSKRDDEGYVYPPDTDPNYEEPLCTDHEKYYTLFLYMSTHLKLSGNIKIERKEEHWGIFREKVSSTIIETERGVETEDIEALFRFFSLVALKALKDHFGVTEVELPKIQVAK